MHIQSQNDVALLLFFSKSAKTEVKNVRLTKIVKQLLYLILAIQASNFYGDTLDIFCPKTKTLNSTVIFLIEKCDWFIERYRVSGIKRIKLKYGYQSFMLGLTMKKNG